MKLVLVVGANRINQFVPALSSTQFCTFLTFNNSQMKLKIEQVCLRFHGAYLFAGSDFRHALFCKMVIVCV